MYFILEDLQKAENEMMPYLEKFKDSHLGKRMMNKDELDNINIYLQQTFEDIAKNIGIIQYIKPYICIYSSTNKIDIIFRWKLIY